MEELSIKTNSQPHIWYSDVDIYEHKLAYTTKRNYIVKVNVFKHQVRQYTALSEF